jgi:hypothetical protein
MMAMYIMSRNSRGRSKNCDIVATAFFADARHPNAVGAVCTRSRKPPIKVADRNVDSSEFLGVDGTSTELICRPNPRYVLSFAVELWRVKCRPASEVQGV